MQGPTIPYRNDLQDFCHLDTDRLSFLIHWLENRTIPHRVLETGDFRHLLIMAGGKKSYSAESQTKILIAHYDRVPETPGANDNSASVFLLLMLAEELSHRRQRHNCLIILTDGEELEGQAGLKEQGAYQLGEKLREFRFDQSLLVVLDLCGRGDTLIHCSSSKRAGLKRSLPPALQEIIYKYSRGKDLSQEKYFSDDLGLIAHSFPTLLVSLLPWQERSYLEQGEMPPAWSDQHSMQDKVDRLEARSFRIMGSFLRGLADLQLPRINS